MRPDAPSGPAFGPSLSKPLCPLDLFAVAPAALGGVRLRARAGPETAAWLDALRETLPQGTPWHRLPQQVGDDALLGGRDLAATLAAGRMVAERGLLARAQGGIVVMPMAERASAALAARLGVALDAQAFGVVLLDEGGDDEAPPASLLDRLALQIDSAVLDAPLDLERIERARSAWRAVTLDDGLIEALVGAAASLGIASSRAAWQAVVATRIAAALQGRPAARDEDAALAARWVLAPRATRAPPPPEDAKAPPPPPADDAARNEHDGEDRSIDPDRPLDERLIEAAQAAIPPGLLALLAADRTAAGPRRGDAGRAGQATASRQRGRSIGAARGDPRRGARLALVDTLRAAAPWQALRWREASDFARAGERESARALPRVDVVQGAHAIPRVHVRREDLRIERRVQQRATTTVFAIDASGSQALHRLAEAKGAVELLLADCYARRDRVAVIGFRGAAAQVLLAPTRSLVRAKRQLAGLPGGGGTPLASGIAAADVLAASVRRGGATPLVVLLTDGRANIARDGTPGRGAAQRDALAAARAFAARGTAALLIDTSPQPSAAARELAAQLGARCIALPYAAADALSAAVRHERGSAGPRGG
jgi:magnesium chelatase subunit D